RAERQPERVRLGQERRPFLVGKAALRADQHGERPTAGSRGERGDRVFYLGVLVAEYEQAPRVARGERGGQAERRRDGRQREDAALLGRLDRVGLHALEVDARDLGVPGEDRLQAGGTHLDGLLHHVVEAGVLERREQIVEVACGALRPRALDQLQRQLAFAGC